MPSCFLLFLFCVFNHFYNWRISSMSIPLRFHTNFLRSVSLSPSIFNLILWKQTHNTNYSHWKLLVVHWNMKLKNLIGGWKYEKREKYGLMFVHDFLSLSIFLHNSFCIFAILIIIIYSQKNWMRLAFFFLQSCGL